MGAGHGEGNHFRVGAIEVRCQLRGEHVFAPTDSVVFELEAFPPKLIQSPVCSPDCGAPPPMAPATTCKTHRHRPCSVSATLPNQAALPTLISSNSSMRWSL
jgi:hypothetical protein